MRTSSIVAIASLLIFGGGAELGAQTGEARVRLLLEHAGSVLEDDHFDGGPPYVTTLARGYEQSTSLRVRAGYDYVVVATCDERCRAPVVSITTGGAPLATGVADGPFNVASYRASRTGVLGLTLGMGSCDAARCAVGHQVFERRSTVDLAICVVQAHGLVEITAQYDLVRGDTTVAGHPFHQVHPSTAPTYAADASWVKDGRPVSFGGHEYRKYGFPRVLGVDEVERVGAYRGTDVFAAAGGSEVIYVPIRTGCEFQPYQRAAR